MTLLADLLHLFKHIIVDNALMGIGENRLLFNGIIPLLLIPDRIGVSLEVHRAACVLPAFQNPDNCAVTPAIRVLRFLIGAFDPLQGFVGSRCQYFVRFQLVCNLLWASAFHAHSEDALYHISSNRINHPATGIFRVFQIAVGDIGCQRNAAFTLCLIDSTDLAAGVSRIKLVSQPRIKNDGLCFDISDKIVVDVNVPFFVIVHGIAFADLNFLNQPHQRGTV